MRIVSIAALMLAACGQPEPDAAPVADGCEVGLQPGQCPPDFTLTSAEGVDVTLSDLQGKRVVVLGTSNW